MVLLGKAEFFLFCVDVPLVGRLFSTHCFWVSSVGRECAFSEVNAGLSFQGYI